MKKLKKDQRGITLVEMVIVIALTGVVTASITIATLQVINMNTSTSNHMTAVSQVQHAGKLVSEDILEAQEIDDTPTGGEFLILGWTGQNGTEHEVIYTLEGSGEFKILRREYSINSSLDSTTKVAEYIDPAETSCVLDGDAFIFTVTATVGGQSETRVYEVTPRPGSQ